MKRVYNKEVKQVELIERYNKTYRSSGINGTHRTGRRCRWKKTNRTGWANRNFRTDGTKTKFRTDTTERTNGICRTIPEVK